MQNLKNVAVIGGGAFGTAIAEVAAATGKNNVKLWARDQNLVDSINNDRKHTKLFKGFTFNDKIFATTDIKEALQDAEIVFGCLPTQVTPKVLREIKDIYPIKAPFVSCSKGMIVEKEKFLSEEVEDIFGPGNLKYCILSGPSFAQQMLDHHPTLVVVASKDEEAAKLVQNQLSYKYFRVYSQGDVIGVEVAGALKNILAIGAGVIEGSGYGINTTSAFIARGTKEIYSFAEKYGAKSETLFGLAGIGDIMLTGFGSLSRNRTFGFRLGKGESVEEILRTSAGVVEGVSTLQVVEKIVQQENLNMPITLEIASLIRGEKGVDHALEALMLRELEPEFKC